MTPSLLIIKWSVLVVWCSTSALGNQESHSRNFFRELSQELENNPSCDAQCLQRLSLHSKMEGKSDSSREMSSRRHQTLETPSRADPLMCLSVPTELRFDCYPGEGSNQDSCESRGCCWDDSEKGFESANFYELYPREPPSCFYPPDYEGYQITDTSDTELGFSGTLERATLSGYPNDIRELKMEFLYETETRLRIRITDPSEARWEPPLPVVPEVNSSASSTLYDISIVETQGDFTVTRKETQQPLFDTRNAAPLTFADQFLQISTFLPSDYIYGLGQHLEGLLLDTYWHRRLLWNYDQGIKPDTNLYGSHPFYLSFEPDGKTHGVFLLNSNAIDIIIQPSPAITFRALGGIIDMYLFLGPTPSDVIRQYTDVIGKPFLPPYWSLGYHQCRYNYFSVNRTREVWQQTRDAGIPYDVQWNDIDSLEEFRIFTYNQTFFDGLPEFVEELHSVEMKYIPIVDPGLPHDTDPGEYPPTDEALAAKVLIMADNGEEYIGRAWPGATSWPDFTNPDTFTYWEEQFQIYHDLVQYDGAWLDMNEPANFDQLVDECNASSTLNNPPYSPPFEGGFISYRTICMSADQYLSKHYFSHNLYSITNNMATNNALRSTLGTRPFIISRSSYPGLGKYAGHWAGDSESTYEQMHDSIGDILNFGLFGVPMIGSDICGFNHNTTVPLCVKWYLFGAFYPFARNHNNEFCVPQDPVSLGEPVVTVARNSLFERYRLLPFLYSLFFSAHLTGEPVARPLFYEYPEDKNTYTIDTEFMWGSSLLIVPALGNETFEVAAYFPKGLWYNWYTGILSYDSAGEYHDIIAPEDLPNLFFKGGSIIPQQSPGVTTAASRRGNFGLQVALDESQSGTGELFWDDGESLNTVQDQAYNFFTFVADQSGLNTTATIGYPAPMILDYVRVLGLSKDVTEVQVNGISVDFEFHDQVLTIFGFQVDMMEFLQISW